MRGHLIQLLVFALLCLSWPATSRADIAVIVNPDNPVQAMTTREVSDLYLGRARSFASAGQNAGTSALLYEQDSPLRDSFFHSLNGMNIRQLNAYWARLRFSGEVLPPVVLPDNAAVLEAVKRNRSAIGYVDSSAVNGAVKVVLRLKE